ncbi:hypothetical protein [Fusobacterium necrophorum]|uniref:hypothetical protein n=1 Tax=Fusobacterium necrophorum TaxID=859 RepID=UPI00370F7074
MKCNKIYCQHSDNGYTKRHYFVLQFKNFNFGFGITDKDGLSVFYVGNYPPEQLKTMPVVSVRDFYNEISHYKLSVILYFIRRNFYLWDGSECTKRKEFYKEYIRSVLWIKKLYKNKGEE